MSTLAAPALDVSGTAAVPLTRLIRVEMRKSIDTLASFWLVMSILIITAIIDAFVLIASVTQDESVGFGDFASLSFVATAILLPFLGIMLVTGEWSQRTAMVTFALEPKRSRVMTAKALVALIYTVLTWLAALAVGALCTAISEAVNPDITSWTLGGGEIFGFFFAQLFAMIGGFALACLLLNTPTSIVVFLLYRFALPTILYVIAGLVDAFSKVSPYLNFVDAQDPIVSWNISTGTEWAHFVVAAALWLGVPLVFGLRRILRAEVK